MFFKTLVGNASVYIISQMVHTTLTYIVKTGVACSTPVA